MRFTFRRSQLGLDVLAARLRLRAFSTRLAFGLLRMGLVIVVMAMLVPVAWSAPPVPENDQLEFARTTKEALEADEKEASRLQEGMMDSLELAVDRFDLKKLDSTDEVIHALHPLVRELSATAQDILQHDEAYLTALRRLHKNLSTAPTTFSATGKLFEEYAAEEPFSEIKEDYLTLAESWYRMADTTALRTEAILQEGKEMTEFKKYLERSSLFLTRLDSHLSSYPDVSEEKNRQQQLARMRHYITGFEALRSSMRRFHDKMKATPPAAPATDSEGVEAEPAVLQKKVRQWPAAQVHGQLMGTSVSHSLLTAKPSPSHDIDYTFSQ